MSKPIVQTHAGDSDGGIWGIEGMNILFILAGVLLGVDLALLLARHYPPAFSIGLGTLPFAFGTAYVFLLRQGKPKSHDTGMLETLVAGTGWTAPARQSRNPLRESA
ncbi:MAG TPA: hypothetical protein VIS96_09720 [Terrimicrobiaceae bacterium]